MVRLIMGEKGTGKTKKLIELINASAAEENGNVVWHRGQVHDDLRHPLSRSSHFCRRISDHHLRGLRGFVSGLYAGNYDISHIFIDNLFKIVGGDCNQAADDFLDWLNRFSNNHGVKFTVSVSGDPGLATDGMQKYL